MASLMKYLILLILVFPEIISAQDKDLSYSTNCSSSNNQVTISFVGDILIHEALYKVVVNETKHFSQIWKKVEGLFLKADFSLGNLEGAAAMGIDGSGKDHGDIGFVYDDFVYSGTHFSFNYHPRILTDLKKSGFDLITSANNHAMDRTATGIDKTIAAARSAGLSTIGVHESFNPDGLFYKIAFINNINVAFLGCTEMTNGNNDFKNQILKCFNHPEKILGIIRDLKNHSEIDAIIVFPHWGVEYSHTPEAIQKSFAHQYIEAGAIAVVGSHPHVIQPWEKYIATDGREGFIVYSLGNFVAGQAGLERKTGPVAYLGLSKKENEKARIFGVGYTPTYRTGAVLNPIGSGDAIEVLKHVASMFGSKRRIEPNANLLESLCKH